MKYCLYCAMAHDTTTVTFDHIVQLAILHDGGVRLSYDGPEDPGKCS